MTKAQANYTETTECCRYCKHLRSDITGITYCSLFDKSDNFVELEDKCDSFKGIW